MCIRDRATREEDWLRQAKRDLEHARHALGNRDYEWSCFAAQQAAVKAVKAVKALYQKLGADARKLSRSVKTRYFDKKLQIQNNCKSH